jgi:hypothetical protein
MVKQCHIHMTPLSTAASFLVINRTCQLDLPQLNSVQVCTLVGSSSVVSTSASSVTVYSAGCSLPSGPSSRSCASAMTRSLQHRAHALGQYAMHHSKVQTQVWIMMG